MDLFFSTLCFDSHYNKISLFSITPCQVFVNAISMSCDFCLKTVRLFFFLYLILHKLLLQKFRIEYFVQLNSIVVYTTMYLLRVLFYDGEEHTFCVCQQGKIDYSFGLKIHNRYRRVGLTRSCSENEQGEVSALFQETQKFSRGIFKRNFPPRY